MDPLSATASLIAILQLSSKVVAYLTDVKNASKEHAKCAIEASNLHSLLLNLKFRLEEGSAEMPWYTTVRALAVENGPLDQFKEALELLQTKMTNGGRMHKAGEALIWKFKKEEVNGILDRMERLKSMVEIALEMDHFKLSQAIECNTRAIKDDTASVRLHVDNVEHRDLLEWVSSADFSTQQSDIIKRKQEGTGKWFLDSPEVARWQSEPKATLFCPGIPGAGKTMVSAIAVEHLLKSTTSSSVGVAYLFFNYKSQEGQDVTNLLATILKQLVQSQPSLMEPVKRLHKEHANKRTKPSTDEIFASLKSTVLGFSTVHIVVDALDECRNDDGTRRQFLAHMQTLQNKADVRLLATSRFLPDIVDKFKTAMRLEIRASDEDVRRFVAGQVHRLPNCIQRKQELQILVQDKIVESVGGMFLLARLYTDSLLDKRTPKEVKATLKRLSKGSAALDNAYKDAIQRIEGQLAGDHARAKEVLSWIAYAQRPLTTAEICCALAVEHTQEELDPENVPDVDDLVSVCAGLVVIDDRSRIIRLVHYTAQDYLERIMEVWNPRAQKEIASTCLTYLSFDGFKSGTCSTDEEFEQRLQRHTFLDYASKHWGQHIFPVQDEVYDLASSFLLHEGSVACAIQAMSVPTHKQLGYSAFFPRDRNFTHLAAEFGLFSLLQKLLDGIEGEEVALANSKDSYGQTGLYMAAINGHDKTVSVLLDKGADIDAPSGLIGTALCAAIPRGHEQVVKVLLSRGADVNAEGGAYDNALLAASIQGYEAITKLLLENGADVNAKTIRHGSALQTASNQGHKAIVKLLLNNGADVNAQSVVYGNAVQVASHKGHEVIVKLLLDTGADVDTQSERHGSALLSASSNGYDAIVKLLLDTGANVNTQSIQHGSALLSASSNGYESIVKLLLDNGANVNASHLLYGNALQAASSKGYEAIAKLLLDNGANVNAQCGILSDHEYVNENGNLKVVAKSSNRDAKDALQAASSGGHWAVVRLLRARGAKSAPPSLKKLTAR